MTRHHGATLAGLSAAAAIIASLVLGPSVRAATYTVLNLDDSGASSLRWCIERADANAAEDRISFDPVLAPGVIRPLTDLPALTGNGDTIDGDVDDDGKPDFTIDGEGRTITGLRIIRPLVPAGAPAAMLLLDFPQAPVVRGCSVIGLAIVRCGRYGMDVQGRGGNTIRSCHFGANRNGTAALPNGGYDLHLYQCDGNTIGGPLPADRNVFVGPDPEESGQFFSVFVRGSDNNVIIGNHFGVNRAGTAALRAGAHALSVWEGTGNRIGGAGNRRNIFGDHVHALRLDACQNAVVQGNYFGLGRDGTTAIPLSGDGIHVLTGSVGNQIGGTAEGAGNVFGGGGLASKGIRFIGADTHDNTVLGNDFGATADGSEQRDWAYGVVIDPGAGAQTIGGTALAAGNRFTTDTDHEAVVVSGGTGTTVVGNSFGLLRSGATAPIGEGVSAGPVTAFVTDNLFARAGTGVAAESGSDVRLFRNRFRLCEVGVSVASGGRAVLGNLSDASAGNDGGNIFRTSNHWHIYSRSADGIRAEGNSFDTTVRSEIDERIFDRLDDPALGRVDFDPLAGNVHPTGLLGPASLAVTGAAALPTPLGAEISFTLSAQAGVTVEVLNVAGRTVAMVARDAPTEPGVQRVAWTGRTVTGTTAPAGRYLVRLTARSADGHQTQALTTLSLTR